MVLEAIQIYLFISGNFENSTNLLNITFDGKGINKWIIINYNNTQTFFAKDNSNVFLQIKEGIVSYENLDYHANYLSGKGLPNLTIPTMSKHVLLIGGLKSDGNLCDSTYECSGGYCNSGVCASSAPSTSSTETQTGSGVLGIFRPSQNNLANGYTVKIKETQKVEIPVGEDKKQIVVESVNGEEIVVSANEEDYNVNSDNSAKIDLNNDGYYDVEVLINGKTINGYANLEFKLINEEIPKTNEEEQNENIFDEIPQIVKKISGWKVYALIGIILFLIIIWFLLDKKIKHKRRYMLYGY